METDAEIRDSNIVRDIIDVDMGRATMEVKEWRVRGSGRKMYKVLKKWNYGRNGNR